ncbi:MAG: HigA family addiction module antidote protein [Patescibacteria group bacterium]|nr:HigA family addiction module antidote protein [Patescibacteria group bacterium]
MATIKPREYRPDTAIAPGATISEMLLSKGITQAGLAERMKRPANKINEILRGKRAITAETALELELVLGLPAGFWLELEKNYQLARKRIDAAKRIEEQAATASLFPLREMARFGWIQKVRDPAENARRLLAFFGIASFSQLRSPNVMEMAFRRSQTERANPYSLAAWVRRGQIEATEANVESFDAKGLRASIPEFRALSLLPPHAAMPKLAAACARFGVAVVYVPLLPKSYVCGAAYWLGDKAVIQLSLRFRSDDHLWFSFFHELGHILLHGKKNTFLDDFKPNEDEKEREANEFARKSLIPDAQFERLVALDFTQTEVVRRFAREIGIAPGVVVGRLQHDQLIAFSELNSLKIRLDTQNGLQGATREC